LILAITSSFHETQICLNNGQTVINQRTIDGKSASSTLIPTIDKLLNENLLEKQNIKVIAVDAGPGAFTSVRISVTTANALAFALGAQILSFSGLAELATEIITNKPADCIVTMLNAYSQEVYVSVWNNIKQRFELENQCLHIDNLLKHLQESTELVEISFGGNGAKLHQAKITNSLDSKKIAFLEGFDQITATAIAIKAAIILKTPEQALLQTKALPLYIKPGLKGPLKQQTLL
jgi:tRNA threonylcarbamoyl adenosine modification protein YeaZ